MKIYKKKFEKFTKNNCWKSLTNLKILADLIFLFAKYFGNGLSILTF